MRTKHTFRLPPDLAGKLADYATRKRVPQALIVEAALASHLSPDGADRLEAALARRLDRMTRHLERIERHVDISNEALAVFVRFWLTSTPALPDAALAAAQTKGRERYEGFVDALGRRLAADEGWLMRSAETSMQKHIITAKPNERATRSARPSRNRWPIAVRQVWRGDSGNLPFVGR